MGPSLSNPVPILTLCRFVQRYGLGLQSLIDHVQHFTSEIQYDQNVCHGHSVRLEQCVLANEKSGAGSLRPRGKRLYDFNSAPLTLRMFARSVRH